MPHLIDIRHGFFFRSRQHPFKLSAEEAAEAVAGSLEFRINFSFNSQAFAYSRQFLAKLRAKGPIFRSPFPDYYIANVAFALSTSTVIIPEPLAIAGVSKASYGYAMYNNQHKRGDALLNIDYSDDPVYQDIRGLLLPGPSYNTNFVLAMEHVARVTRAKLNREANFHRYRQLQVLCALRDQHSSSSGKVQSSAWPEIRARLTVSELIWALLIRSLMGSGRYFPLVRQPIDRKLAEMSSMNGFGPMVRDCGKNNYTTVVELYDAFEAGKIR